MKRFALIGMIALLATAVAGGVWLMTRDNQTVASDTEQPTRNAQELEAELVRIAAARQGLPAARQLGNNANTDRASMLQQELVDQQKRPAAALEEARIALADLEKRIASTTDPAERVRIEAHIALVESIVAKLERM